MCISPHHVLFDREQQALASTQLDLQSTATSVNEKTPIKAHKTAVFFRIECNYRSGTWWTLSRARTHTTHTHTHTRMNACTHHTNKQTNTHITVKGNIVTFLLMPSGLSFVFLWHTQHTHTHTHTHTHIHTRARVRTHRPESTILYVQNVNLTHLRPEMSCWKDNIARFCRRHN